MTYEELEVELTKALDTLHALQGVEKQAAKKEYCVSVDITYSTTFYVDATSEEEAEKLAEVEAEETSGPGSWVKAEAHFVEVCESIYKNDPDQRENKLKSRRLRTLERAAAHELFCEDGTTPLSLEAAQDYINELEWKVKNADYKARNPEVA